MSREEPEPAGNTQEGRTELCNWRKRQNNAQSIIFMGCSDQILSQIQLTVDPAEMWDILHTRFDSRLSQLRRTQILRTFHSCHPATDKKIITYCTSLIDYGNQLSGSAEVTSEDSFVTHLFTSIPKKFASMINILERQAPPPTSQQIMDAFRWDEEKGAFLTEIADASTVAALHSRCGGHRGCGCGGSGRFGQQMTYWCTYCKMDNHTTDACSKQKRAQSGNGNSGGNSNSGGNGSSGGDNAEGSNEKACYHCEIPGHIIRDCIHYKHAKKTWKRVCNSSTSIATAGDRDLLWLSGHALTASWSTHTTWVVDSVASHNMCNNRSSFKSFKKLRWPMLIELGDDNTVWVTHHGLVDTTQGYEIDALYTPTFHLSLFTVNQLDSTRSTAMFGSGKCSISSTQSPITIISHHVNDLYVISPTIASAHTASPLDGRPSTPQITDSCPISKSTRKKRTQSMLTIESTSLSLTTPPSAPPNIPPSTPAISSPNALWSEPRLTFLSPPIATTKSMSTQSALTISQSTLWHCRVAHMHPTSVQSLIPEYMNYDRMCTMCIQPKHTQKFIWVKVQRTALPFALVHSDVCGPFSTSTFGGNKRFILFIDDYTPFTFVWILPDKKSETCTATYMAFQARVITLGCQITRFWCDNGWGEYDNKTFRLVLTASGTTYEPCLPCSHQKNGVAERIIRTITKKARAMMIDS